MTSPLNRYGGMPRPEQKRRYDVAPDPVNVVRSAYNVWKAVADRTKFAVTDVGTYDTGVAGELYEEACRLISPHAEAFACVEPYGLEQAVLEIEKERKNRTSSGLFLSAVLNVTSLPVMAGVFNSKLIGYRLAEGKVLIVPPSSRSLFVGEEAEGGVLINYSNCRSLARGAKRGLQINYGNINQFGMDSSGGVQINFGSIALLGIGATGFVQFNLGTLVTLSFPVERGLVVNYGQAHEFENYYSQGYGTVINAGVLGKFRKDEGDMIAVGRFVNFGLIERMSVLGDAPEGWAERIGAEEPPLLDDEDFLYDRWDARNALDKKGAAVPLKELEEKLSVLKESLMINVSFLAAYDWQTLEADVKRLAGEVRNGLK